MPMFATLQSIRAEADGMSLVLQVFVNKMSTQNCVLIHLVDIEIFHTISEHFDLPVVFVRESLQSLHPAGSKKVCTKFILYLLRHLSLQARTTD